MNNASACLKNALSIGVLLLISLVGLGGCSFSSPAPSFQNATPITIGASLSLSREFAEAGKALQKGYQLWQDAVNKRGGLLGRPVKFDFLADDSTPAKVAANYQQMITQNHDNLVVGPYSTLLTQAAAPIAQQHNYAFIEGTGVGPAVFEPNYNNLFSVSLSATSYLKSFVYFILSLPKVQRPTSIAFASNDDSFTKPQIEAARTLLEADGEKTVFYDIYSTSAPPNYAAEANKIIAAHPDVVILGTVGQQDCVAYIQAFKQQHFNPSAIIATAGPDEGDQFFKPLGGPDGAEGIFVPNGGWFPTVNNFQNSQFVADYLARYGGSANDISANTVKAYAVGQVLEQAVTKIHSIDNAKLIQELHADTFNTLQGPVKFASDGENKVAVAFLFQWQDGQLFVVYPTYAAQKNPEFPKQSW